MDTIKTYRLTTDTFKSLFDTMYAPMCLFANKYLNNLDVAKDVVQEVFVKIWEDKIAFQNEHSIKAFLYTSVKNRALDYLKSKHQKVLHHYTTDDLAKMESDSFFFREVVVTETSAIIDRAVSTLPEKCAQIIKLSLKNYTNSEIAQELSISINTVKTQKKIAYKKLRPLLKESLLFFTYLFNS